MDVLNDYSTAENSANEEFERVEERRDRFLEKCMRTRWKRKFERLG